MVATRQQLKNKREKERKQKKKKEENQDKLKKDPKSLDRSGFGNRFKV